MGRFLVDVPFYTMVNLIAGREVVPEIMQEAMTGERLAAAARRLLDDREARERMERDLAEVSAQLSGEIDPLERAASAVREILNDRE
jgi:lipid-A-disaccharide synthase